MPILRLAYSTQFLIALIAVFMLWSQVGGQSHLDLMPWYLKLGLGAGAAFTVVKATAASVSREPAWNSGTLRWVGILLAFLIGCGLATYYYHTYEEDKGDEQQDQSLNSRLSLPVFPAVWQSLRRAGDLSAPARLRSRQTRAGLLDHAEKINTFSATTAESSGLFFA